MNCKRLEGAFDPAAPAKAVLWQRAACDLPCASPLQSTTAHSAERRCDVCVCVLAVLRRARLPRRLYNAKLHIDEGHQYARPRVPKGPKDEL